MAKKQFNSLLFPVGGLNKATAFQTQPPFTTPDCLNVRPDDSLEERSRGGDRPGLKKTFQSQIGSGNPIKMLGKVREADSSSEQSFFDHFTGISEGTNLDILSTYDLDPNSDGTLDGINSTWVEFSDSADSYNGVVREATSLSDFQKVVSQVRCNITPNDTLNAFITSGPFVNLFFRLDDTTPDPQQDGIEVTFAPNSNDDGQFSVKAWSGGASVTKTTSSSNLDSTPNTQDPQWPIVLEATYRTATHPSAADEIDLRVLVSYATDPPQWHALVTALDVSADVGGTGTRTGFALEENSSQIPDADYFTGVYTRNDLTAEYGRERLVGLSNAALYREEASDWEAVTMGNVTMQSGQYMQSVEHSGKLYIADHELVADSTTTTAPSGTKAIVDTSATHLTDIGTSLQIAAGYWLEIYGGSADDGVYAIASSTETTVTITSSTNLTDASNVKYRIFRAVKVYNAASNAVAALATSVTDVMPPAGCPLIARYRGRIVLAGAQPNPTLWFMSRSNDPDDWDFSENDSAAAIAGNVTEAGVVGEPISALIAAGDDYLVIGCPNSIYVVTGELGLGGQIDNVSRTTGIIHAKAWAILPNNTILFLSRNEGVQGIGSGGLVELSRIVLPDEFENLDPNDEHLMVYDPEEEGVYLFITSSQGESSQWFYDPRNNTYWPMSFANASHYPHAVLSEEPAEGFARRALVGCADGYLRNFDDDQLTDDGTAIASHVVIGPIRLGGDDHHSGSLVSLDATLATGSNNVVWEVYRGDYSQEAVEAAVTGTSAFDSGAWSAGRNYTNRPRMRGGAMALRIEGASSPTAKWAMETIALERLTKLGRQRITN